MTDDAQDCSATFGYPVDPRVAASVSDLDCPGGRSAPAAARSTVSTQSPTSSCCQVRIPRKGIAKGRGSTFYAGELFTGDIFRGNVRLGTATKFIDAPEGRNALGMVFDRRHNLLFVAGGATGQGYIYNTRSRQTVASYQFGAAGASLINDVTLTRRGAWFTDSAEAAAVFRAAQQERKPAENLQDAPADRTSRRTDRAIQPQWDSRRAITAAS